MWIRGGSTRFPHDVYRAQEDIDVWEDRIDALVAWYEDETATYDLLTTETRERLPSIASMYGELEDKLSKFQESYQALLLMNQEPGTPNEDSLEAIEEFEKRFYEVERKQDNLSTMTQSYTGRQVEDYQGLLQKPVTQLQDVVAEADDVDLAVTGACAAALGSELYHQYRKRYSH